MTKKQKLEHSDFSGEFTDDGITVLVDIFRKEGSTDGWTMEVIDQDEGLTVWEEPFATDKEAFEEFFGHCRTRRHQIFSGRAGGRGFRALTGGCCCLED